MSENEIEEKDEKQIALEKMRARMNSRRGRATSSRRAKKKGPSKTPKASATTQKMSFMDRVQQIQKERSHSSADTTTSSMNVPVSGGHVTSTTNETKSTPLKIPSLSSMSNTHQKKHAAPGIKKSPRKKTKGSTHDKKKKKKKGKTHLKRKLVVKDLMDLSSLEQISTHNGRLRAYRGVSIRRCRVNLPGSKRSKAKKKSSDDEEVDDESASSEDDPGMTDEERESKWDEKRWNHGEGHLQAGKHVFFESRDDEMYLSISLFIYMDLP